MKKFDKKELSKIIIMGFLLTVCIFLTYYFHFILKTEVIFTHLFYIPILLASLWWARKGIIVSVCLAMMLLVLGFVDPIDVPIYTDLIRASMFVVIGTIIGILSEKRYLLEGKLRAYSKDLEQRAEERTSEIRELQEKQKAILDNVSDVVVVLDNNLNIIWANKIAKDQYQVVFGEKCYQLYKDQKVPCSDCIARKIFTDGIVRSSEEEAILKDGRRFNFIVSCSPIKDSQGEIISVVEVFHDITESKKDQEKLKKYREHLEELVKGRTIELEEKTEELEHANLKLQELDRLKSMFIASMSHELRTPLNSIIGFTGIVLQGMSGEVNSKQRKQLTLVKNSANHLLALINDVIDIGKIEVGKVEIAIEEFDLSVLAQEIRDSFAVMADKKGLELSIKRPPTLIIESDKRRTEQVLVNFVNNAVKFTDRGGIEIKLVKKDKTAEISVRDTGVGVKKEDMNKLFKDFSRIPIKDRTIEGTGLGLYLSKKIAELLDGKIKAESEFGKGSILTLTLPLKR